MLSYDCSSLGDCAVEALQAYIIPEERGDYMVPMEGIASGIDMDIDANLDPQLTGAAVAASPPRPESQHLLRPAMRSNLRLFPPPLFSRQTIPQAYKSGHSSYP